MLCVLVCALGFGEVVLFACDMGFGEVALGWGESIGGGGV